MTTTINTVSTFTSSFEMLEEFAPEFIDSLSDEGRDLLEGTDTYDALRYTVINGETVVASDDLSGIVYSTVSLEEFVNQTRAWIEEET